MPVSSPNSHLSLSLCRFFCLYLRLSSFAPSCPRFSPLTQSFCLLPDPLPPFPPLPLWHRIVPPAQATQQQTNQPLTVQAPHPAPSYTQVYLILKKPDRDGVNHTHTCLMDVVSMLAAPMFCLNGVTEKSHGDEYHLSCAIRLMRKGRLHDSLKLMV